MAEVCGGLAHTDGLPDRFAVCLHKLSTHVVNNAHSRAQVGLGQFAAVLVDPNNGEEHRATVGFIQRFSSS